MTARLIAREAYLLRQEGMTLKQIASVMGISYWAVCKYLPEADRDKHSAKIDNQHKALSELPDDVRRWLAEITPDGASISDVIRSIITDAYSEENGTDRARQRQDKKPVDDRKICQ